MAALSDEAFTARTNHFVNGYAGATRNVHTGEAHDIGHPGFIVAIPGPHEKTVYNRKVTTADTSRHRAKMLGDPKVQADPQATQGSWHRGPEGAEPVKVRETTFDQGTRVHTGNRDQDLHAAMHKGKDGAQKAIFDLKNGSDITVNHRNLANAAYQATISPQRPSAFKKPNPLFGEK